MYCKFCGNRINTSYNKCLHCGATIDLNDGGQSFFDDNELKAWQNNGNLSGLTTSMPKTEMKEPLIAGTNDRKKEYLKSFNQIGGTYVGVSRRDLRKRRKKRKLLDISNSNKLIVFSIVSVLIIVLLVFAILSALSVENESNEENTIKPTITEQVNENSDAETAKDKSETDNNVNTDNDKSGDKNNDEHMISENRTEIKDIKIYDRQGKEISHNCSAYIDENNTLYVSIDKILRHEGYKNGISNGNDKNRTVYERSSDGKIIEIEKGTRKIWIKTSDNKTIAEELSDNNFNVGNDTYVPIKSFLIINGYAKDKIVWNEKDCELYFNK